MKGGKKMSRKQRGGSGRSPKPYELLVKLTRDTGQDWGFTHSWRYDGTVLVEHVEPGGRAAAGQLQVNDQIVSVNGQSLDGPSEDEVKEITCSP